MFNRTTVSPHLSLEELGHDTERDRPCHRPDLGRGDGWQLCGARLRADQLRPSHDIEDHLAGRCPYQACVVCEEIMAIRGDALAKAILAVLTERTTT
jgi:hypothetical protein